MEAEYDPFPDSPAYQLIVSAIAGGTLVSLQAIYDLTTQQ